VINIGVIGCGYWGPNLIRNFNELSDSNLLAICDLDKSKLNKMKRRYPYVKTFSDYHDLLRDSLLEAVVVATPAFTHYPVVKECILAGKDTFVEKPLTLRVEEGKEREDVVFVTLYFSKKVLAHIHVSWLDPHKIRKMTIVGSKKMVVFDDMERAKRLILYDREVERVNNNYHYNSFGEALSLKFGDIHIPRINSGELLKLECQHF